MERHFIEHCSPTLASIKCANLFSYNFADQQEFEQTLAKWNAQFVSKGIQLYVLRRKENNALVYMFRPRKLQLILESEAIKEFLGRYGYTDFSPQSVIGRLAARVSASEEFPHEIGIMLGYPLDDVKSFIKNKGKNCKFVGPWKVYHNENEAIRFFAKLKKCKDVYTSLYTGGRSVMQMTVAA